MTTTVSTELAGWLVAWLVVAGVLLVTAWRRGQFGCGLVFAYVAHYSLLHWFGALVHSLPWAPFWDFSTTIDGFKASLYGLFACAAGRLFLFPFLERMRPSRV